MSEETTTAPADEVLVAEVKSEAPAAGPRTAAPLPEGQHYIWGTGRRKASVARVRIRPGKGVILVNKRPLEEFFNHIAHRNAAVAPLVAAGLTGSYDVWVNVNGGGMTGQAEAVMLGLARALSKAMPDVDRELRNKGLLTRDARAKERKKPGQPGARKRFQFSKR
ncbi:MAG: 30S ribosomal protein S9 [Phycisphaerales bacterium]|jgi:small subunit ribosomal protein S9|nr:30S ribosomal protein S9 [Phycisphaerales bacterium]MBT7172021.1 30S ribosomal protein S9 [Phycisphaerales bacterium]